MIPSPDRKAGRRILPERRSAMKFLAVIAGLLLLSSNAVFGGPAWKTNLARANIRNAVGQTVGVATFTQEPQGVRVPVTVWNLLPGKHGTHIHEMGRCDMPYFHSAGGHLNPEGRKHGRKNPEGAHAGDLPNLEVGEYGTGMICTTIPGLTLRIYTPTAIFSPIGAAVCIDAAPDDEMTDPDGNSRLHIACGVLEVVYETGER
jgi:Cu-Zn family superoxide dismutase